MPKKRKEKTLGWGEPRVYYRLGSEGENIQPGSSGTEQIWGYFFHFQWVATLCQDFFNF